MPPREYKHTRAITARCNPVEISVGTASFYSSIFEAVVTNHLFLQSVCGTDRCQRYYSGWITHLPKKRVWITHLPRTIPSLDYSVTQNNTEFVPIRIRWCRFSASDCLARCAREITVATASPVGGGGSICCSCYCVAFVTRNGLCV